MFGGIDSIQLEEGVLWILYLKFSHYVTVFLFHILPYVEPLYQIPQQSVLFP